MATIKWNPALEVGHPEIDQQHRELFRRLDALVEAMAAGDRKEIGLLFEFLGGYVVEHFGEEERLMQESAFPGQTIHKAAHERFVRDYQALRKLFEDNGPTAAVVIKTKTWIADWLVAHIGATDQQLAKHLLRKSA
jgi:hemerythrin